jgi:regulatory protein
MHISNIKQQAKDSNRVSVFLDGKYSFSLSLDEVVATKIKVGLELSEPELKKFKKISADGKLRSRALEWLINRPHATSELKDYLYRKKAEPEQIESLVNEFIAKGYLNDVKYAGWYIDVLARRGKSNRAIRSELASKRVDRKIIDELIVEYDDEKQRLKMLIEKKQKLSRYRSDNLKLAQYLTSQGFSYGLVKEVLETGYRDD